VRALSAGGERERENQYLEEKIEGIGGKKLVGET